jgi:pSer/pThr/pTyr-binding forkhead associated (FHA) protein
MEQARNYVCKECSTAVPSGHKFCGTCGAAVPPEVVELRTKYFGTMQTPGKARLILIRGEGGVDGLSYMLQGTEHLAGREDGQILFPEDSWLSPRHANFVYEHGQLVVKDEGSLNGVYVRVRAPVALGYGDTFLCGEQLFKVEPAPRDTSGPAPDQTYFYSSPRKRYTYRVTQVLTGGGLGLSFCATGTSVVIGREECDLNYPQDVYMSGSHAKVEMMGDGVFNLVDTDSKNGTYVRIKGPQKLSHGDYLFLGRELLRVEMTA